ncbi:hypothetical protein Hanom_Chr11g01049801 [Helianthus anomalus]
MEFESISFIHDFNALIADVLLSGSLSRLSNSCLIIWLKFLPILYRFNQEQEFQLKFKNFLKFNTKLNLKNYISIFFP